jgi:hemerythrin-like domain-containing protein
MENMMTASWYHRRRFLKASVCSGAGLVATCAVHSVSRAAAKEKAVTANEDLMREHGVLRRALLVYRASAVRLRADPATVPASALMKTARLFREFGEDYHERRLEEKLIFPTVRKLKNPAAAYPDVLQQQHDRGRELTDYVMRVASGGSIAGGNAMPLAQALEAFDLMYEHHTAREDTIVFPAWKDALSERAYKALSEQFESIEKQVFGHDGFEDAVQQISQVESQLGLSDISQFTMPKPPGR